jgi:hypothetical protein
MRAKRRYCFTRRGVYDYDYEGICGPGTTWNAGITIFEGSSVPFVVRQETGNGAYKLVGACYIHGIMDSKFWEGRSSEASDSITLV